MFSQLVLLASQFSQLGFVNVLPLYLTLTQRDEKSDHRDNAALISKQTNSGKPCAFRFHTDSDSKDSWSWQEYGKSKM